MNPSFSPQSLKGLQPTVDRYVEQLINGVGNELTRNGGIVEMNKWFHNFSFDVLPMLHSESFNCGRLLGHWRWEQISERWQQTATNRISSSKLSTGLSLSLILWFLFAKDPETGAKLEFNDLLINSNTLLFLTPGNITDFDTRVAGAGTTALSLTFGFYYIVANRKVFERLAREIRSAYEDPSQITGRSTASLVYLDAVIHEGTTYFALVNTNPSASPSSYNGWWSSFTARNPTGRPYDCGTLHPPECITSISFTADIDRQWSVVQYGRYFTTNGPSPILIRSPPRDGLKRNVGT
jgi:Cytochrome P450